MVGCDINIVLSFNSALIKIKIVLHNLVTTDINNWLATEAKPISDHLTINLRGYASLARHTRACTPVRGGQSQREERRKGEMVASRSDSSGRMQVAFREQGRYAS